MLMSAYTFSALSDVSDLPQSMMLAELLYFTPLVTCSGMISVAS